jgi:hypothetical protein
MIGLIRMRSFGPIRRIWMSLRCFWGLTRQRRRFVANAALLLGSTVLALLVAEGLSRWVLPPVQIVRVLESGFTARLDEEGNHPMSVDVERHIPAIVETPTGRRLRANTEILVKHHHLGGQNVVLRTNELGFRGPSLGPKRATRVLFLGDSITWADYLLEEQTHVRLVASAAEREGRTIEVVNAGVGGSGLGEQLALLVETGVLANPDAVVLGFYLNDHMASPGVFVRRPPDWLSWSTLAQRVTNAMTQVDAMAAAGRAPGVTNDLEASMDRWRAELRDTLPRGYGDYRTSPEAFNAMAVAAFDDWGAAWSDSVWREVLEPLLWGLKRVTDRHGLRLFVLCFPVSHQVDAQHPADFPQRRLREIAARMEVPMGDMLPHLRAAARASNEPLFYDHCHYTPRGSAIVAEATWAFLRANGI